MLKMQMHKALSEFFTMRRTIALLLTITFCYLTVCEKVASSEFTTVFTMVVGFYFGRSTALDIPGGKEMTREREER